MRRPRYRCTKCGELNHKPFCAECVGTLEAFIERMQLNEVYSAVKNGNITQEQADAILLKVKEWLATHWTERENPRHEIMESVCFTLAC